MLELGSVHSDNITNSLDDWQVFEGLSEKHDIYVVELSTLGHTAWVDDFAGDYVPLLGLVWERSVNYDSIEVTGIRVTLFRDTVQFTVLVVIL